MSEQASDEEVARWKVVHVQVEAWPSGYVCDSCRKVWPCPTVKLLARLEAVEEELEAMKLGYRGFP